MNAEHLYLNRHVPVFYCEYVCVFSLFLWLIVGQMNYYLWLSAKKFLSFLGHVPWQGQRMDHSNNLQFYSAGCWQQPFAGLYHVILLRTRWYIIVPTLAIESLDYERLSGDVLQVTQMASDKTLIRTHSFRPCLVLTVSYIFIWRPEGMLPRRIWAYPTACRDASNVSSKWTAWAMRVLPFWRNALCRGNALGMSYCLAHPGRLVPTGQLPSIEFIMSQFCAWPFQRSHTWEKS